MAGWMENNKKLVYLDCIPESVVDYITEMLKNSKHPFYNNKQFKSRIELLCAKKEDGLSNQVFWRKLLKIVSDKDINLEIVNLVLNLIPYRWSKISKDEIDTTELIDKINDNTVRFFTGKKLPLEKRLEIYQDIEKNIRSVTEIFQNYPSIHLEIIKQGNEKRNFKLVLKTISESASYLKKSLQAKNYYKTQNSERNHFIVELNSGLKILGIKQSVVLTELATDIFFINNSTDRDQIKTIIKRGTQKSKN